jgi:uncharacterized membrane protein (DUF485 family)
MAPLPSPPGSNEARAGGVLSPDYIMSDNTSRTGGERSPSGAPDNPEALLRAIMRRQARLSVRVASLFLLLVLGLPLVNQYAEPLAQTRVAGFSATWLFLGVLFYPITWALSAYFVRASEAVEQETAALAGARPRSSAEENHRG